MGKRSEKERQKELKRERRRNREGKNTKIRKSLPVVGFTFLSELRDRGLNQNLIMG